MEDVTIVIQGRLKSEHIHKWIKEYADWNVIVSTWNDANIDGLEFPPSWKVLLMPKPQRYGEIGNLDYQVTSTLNGLQYVKTTYCIKARGDEFFLNLHKFVKEIKLKPQQIICGDIFYRAEYPDTHYHISDHLLGSTTYNIRDMFSNTEKLLKQGFRIPKEYAVTHSPESHLGFSFVQLRENIDLKNIEEYLNDKVSIPLSEKWFDVFNIERFQNFTVSMRGEFHSGRCSCPYHF